MNLYRDWSEKNVPPLQGQTVLITGANSGIGFETAKRLVQHQARVILACRDLNKGQAAAQEIKKFTPNGECQVMALDLADLSSIDRFVEEFKNQFNQLDILINNAGVMAPPLSRTKDGFEMQFGTNHLGHFSLTGKLLSLLEASPAGRIVVVSSLMHRFGRLRFNNLNAEKFYWSWSAYSQSKLANLIFARSLQQRLKDKGSKIKVIAVHPGYASTKLLRHSRVVSLLKFFSQPPERGCLPTVFAATATQLKGGEYIGPDGFFELTGKPSQAYVASVAKSDTVADKLWQYSEQMTETSYLSHCF